MGLRLCDYFNIQTTPVMDALLCQFSDHYFTTVVIFALDPEWHLLQHCRPT